MNLLRDQLQSERIINEDFIYSCTIDDTNSLNKGKIKMDDKEERDKKSNDNPDSLQ